MSKTKAVTEATKLATREDVLLAIAKLCGPLERRIDRLERLLAERKPEPLIEVVRGA